MTRTSRGHTLIEVLTSLSALSLVLLTSGSLTLFALRTYNLQEARVRPFEGGRLLLLTLAAEVRCAKSIVEPDVNQLTEGLHHIILKRKDDIVAYRLMSERHEVERLIYEPDDRIGGDLSLTLRFPPAVIARDIRNLTCWQEQGRPGLMNFSVEPSVPGQDDLVLKTAAFRQSYLERTNY